MKLWPDKDGYLKFATTANGMTENRIFHRLMYESFVGPIPVGMTVDHIDGDKLNNHPSNLQVMSFEENAAKGNAQLWEALSPDGEVVKIYNLAKFCRENGLHKSHLHTVLKSNSVTYQSHKGWRKVK